MRTNCLTGRENVVQGAARVPSDDPGRPPAWPLAMREFATFSRDESRRVFRDAPRELRRAWGLLHCVDAAGIKWTTLGGPEYTRSLQAAEVPTEPIPGYDHGVGWNRM